VSDCVNVDYNYRCSNRFGDSPELWKRGGRLRKDELRREMLDDGSGQLRGTIRTRLSRSDIDGQVIRILSHSVGGPDGNTILAVLHREVKGFNLQVLKVIVEILGLSRLRWEKDEKDKLSGRHAAYELGTLLLVNKSLERGCNSQFHRQCGSSNDVNMAVVEVASTKMLFKEGTPVNCSMISGS
jgi:hypothetical protein